jgi:hypothetical protein
MRRLKFVTVAAVICAVALSANAGVVNLPNAPLIFDITNWDMGTVYYRNPGQPGPISVAPGAWPGTTIYAPNSGETGFVGADPNEDGYGVLRVNSIFKGMVMGTTIVPDPSEPLPIWVDGQYGVELVGMFHSINDTWINDPDPGVPPTGAQNIYAEGIQLEIWEQSIAGGVWGGTAGPALGSSGRIAGAPNAYTGVGVPGGVAGAELWAAGPGVGGFVGDPTIPATLTADFRSTFLPGVAFAGSAGEALVFWNVDAGSQASNLVVAFWQSPLGTQADLRTEANLEGNNPANVQSGGVQPMWLPDGTPNPLFGLNLGLFDWTVTTNDETKGMLIPEPLTMIGLFVGVSSLAGYIRKRQVA